MEVTVLSLVLNMVEKMCVVVVVAFLLLHLRFFREILAGRPRLRNQLLLALIFGTLAIYGTYSGVKLPSGAITNIRDLGPMVGGLVGGPVVGLVAGLIGGVHRYFMGGLTALPCSIATLVAGGVGGALCLWQRGKRVSLWKAAVFTILVECLHMGLILALARPFDEAVRVVQLIAAPMILGNAAGVFLFTVMVRYSFRRQESAAGVSHHTP